MTLLRSFALATSIGMGMAASAHGQTIQVNKENRTIAVTTTDKVTLLADTATVHVGFVEYGPDSDAAYAAGSRISNAIVKALADSGVPKDAIESENQGVAPVQEYQAQNLSVAEKAQRKFQVAQSWTVRTEADNAAKVLDLAVKAGANQSGQIEWSMKDEGAPDAEAAAKALQHARSQAETMAKSLNAHLGVLLYASNEAQAEPIRPRMRTMAAAPVAMSKVAPLAINPRQIERFATVYAVFAIE